MKNRVLILGGEQYKTISIVRTLGKKGIDVDVCSTSKFALSFFSKYCKKRYRLPIDKKLQLEEIIKILQKNEYDLLIPSSEFECLMLAKYENRLPYNCIILPSYRSLWIAANKILTVKFAKRNSIPVPKTWEIKNFNDLKKIKDKLPYPVVLKPRYIRYHHRPHYVFKKEDFISEYLNYSRRSPLPFIQEMVIGDSYGVFALCKNGKVIQYFSHKRIIEQNPKGAGSARCISYRLIPQLKKYSDTLIKKLMWNGVIMLEFKHDVRDDIFKLIEINGRFWGSLPLAIYSGVDFPYQLYCLATGKKIKIIKRWKNVCARHILGELIYLYRVLKGKPKNWNLYYPNILAALKNVTLSNRCKFFVFDLKDPLPFFVEFIYKLMDVIKK